MPDDFDALWPEVERIAELLFKTAEKESHGDTRVISMALDVVLAATMAAMPVRTERELLVGLKISSDFVRSRALGLFRHKREFLNA